MKKKRETDLVKLYWKDIEMIPIFIDTTKFTHKQCRDIACEMFGNISVLFEPHFLEKSTINYVYDLTITALEEMINIDTAVCVYYTNYMGELLNYYIKESTNRELFEVSNNIFLFLEEYKIIYTYE